MSNTNACTECEANVLKNTSNSLLIRDDDGKIFGTKMYPNDKFCKNCGRPLKAVVKKGICGDFMLALSLMGEDGE